MELGIAKTLIQHCKEIVRESRKKKNCLKTVVGSVKPANLKKERETLPTAWFCSINR